MARDIDEKIVQMRFENSDFERKARETIKSIDDLNRSTSSMGENTAAFDALIQGLDKVNQRFSLMETIARGAFERIGGMVANTGVNLVKSLSIDQVTAGWGKYEEKTRAVQTIMNATGDSIDTVNDYLDKLMWYTDETSYNFVDMTSNIGKFTSQGIKLEDATTAMMGISNWAAQAGQGVQQASMAMYNLSQSIGAGSVMLRDWMSVENANMGTKEFKELAIETAKELGTLTEAAKDAKGEIVTFQNFRDTLQSDWFTSDVLIATLKKYGDYSEEVYQMVQEQGISAAEAMELLGDSYEGVGKKAFEAAQVSKTFTDVIDATKDAVSSGWLQTFELFFGNLEQQKDLWTDVTGSFYDLFAASGEARNALLEDWRDIGGQLVFADVINEILQRFLDLQNLIGAAWSKAFPPMTAEALMNLVVNLRNFVAGLELTDTAAANISDALGGVLSIFRAFGQIVGAVLKGLFPAGDALNSLGGAFVGAAGSVGRTLTKISEFIASEEHLSTITQSVSGIMSKLGNVIVGVVEAFTGLDINGDNVVTTFKGVFQTIKEGISTTLDSSGNLLDILTEVFQKGFERISGFFKASEGETSWLDNLSQTISNVTGDMGQSLPILSQFISALGQLIDVLAQGLVTLSSNIVGTVDWDQIFGLAQLLLVFGILKKINEANPVAEVGELIEGIKDAIGGFKQKLQMDALKSLAEAVAILAGAIVMLGSMPIENAVAAIAGLAAVGAGLYYFLTSLSKLEDEDISKIKKTIPSLLGISASLTALMIGLSTLGRINISGIVSSVVALGIVMAELRLFAGSMSDVKIDAGSILALNAMVLAINGMVPALMMLSLLDFAGITSGLVSLAGLMTELAVFSKVMSGTSVSPATGLSILFISTAITTLSASVMMLANLDLAGIGKALLAIAGLLGEIALFSNLMNGSAVNTAGILLIAVAIDAVTVALLGLSSLSLSEIGSALLAVAGAMAIMTVAMIALGAVGPTAIAAAAGMAMLSASLMLLAPALLILSKIDMDGIGRALLAVAGVLGIFVVAVYLLTPVSGVLLAVAAAFALVAAGAATLIAALSMLGGSLATLAAAIILFGSTSTETVQQAMDNIKLILDEMISWIIKNYAKWKLASLTLFAAFIDALVELAPSIVDGVLSILNNILEALAKWMPTLYENLLKILTVMDEFAIPLGEKAVDLVFHFVEGLIRGLKKHISRAIEAFVEGAKSLWNSFKSALFGGGSGSVEDASAAIVDQAAAGLNKGVKKNARSISGAGRASGKAYLDGFDESMGIASPSEEMIHRADDTANGYKKGTEKNLFKFGESGRKSASEYLEEFKKKMFGEGQEGNVQSVGADTGDVFAKSVDASGAGSKAAKSIAKQIDDDNSIEASAKKKAEKVKEAFETEFSKIDLRMSKVGSEYDIAEAYLGPNAKEEKLNLLKLEQLQKEMAVLADKYVLSFNKYQNTLASPNVSEIDVDTAYKDYLGVYAELAQKANELAAQQQTMYGTYELIEQEVQRQVTELAQAQSSLINSEKVVFSDATKEAYQNFVAATTDTQKQYYYKLWNDLKQKDAEGIFGDIIAKPIDAAQIRAEIYKNLGLDPNNPVQAFSSVNELIQAAVETAKQGYMTGVSASYPGVIQEFETQIAQSADDVIVFTEETVAPQFKRSGEKMADATAEGIEIKASTVSNSAKQMSKNAAQETNQRKGDWTEVGVEMMHGVAEGIREGRSEVINAAIEVAESALRAAKQAMGISSPSREFMVVGMYMADGLAIGLMNSKEEVGLDSRNVANYMVEQFDDVNSRIQKVLDDSLHPVIRPSLDMTGVRRATKNLDNIWSSTTLRTISDISMSELNRRDELLGLRKPVAPIVNNSNNFTQNNYSPKTLSDAELYLQTKKQLDWAFKGVRR